MLQHASQIFSYTYFGVLIAVAMFEWAMPHRPLADTVGRRWLSNFGISIVDLAIVRTLFPMLGFAWALFCQAHGWGLFNRIAVPAVVTFPATILLLDLLYYAQHHILHRVPLLWRVHRTHHTDHEYDFTTGVRFHPLETMLTTTVILAAIFALGAPPAAVFVLQVSSIAFAFIDHANVRVPLSWDRVIRLVLVTPDMHRIHHSRVSQEGNSNFANLFPVWDRLFATYRDRPAAGADVAYGVDGFSARKHLALPWMLAQPFLRADAQVGARAGRDDRSRTDADVV